MSLQQYSGQISLTPHLPFLPVPISLAADQPLWSVALESLHSPPRAGQQTGDVCELGKRREGEEEKRREGEEEEEERRKGEEEEKRREGNCHVNENTATCKKLCFTQVGEQ